MNINQNYQNLKESYLFSTISHKVEAYCAANPHASIIRMGIGDVTLPLCSAVIEALHRAVDEMGCAETFRGYGPEQGYGFLREAICAYYQSHSVQLDAGEIFVGDGAKSDLGNILDLFSSDNTVLIPDPVYPVYVDTNLMAGRRIQYLNATKENNFLPLPDKGSRADLIYLCSPNNPTGAAYNREQLAQWVAAAKQWGAVLLFDAAYEAFVQDKELPHSIYEVEGASDCAIEFCSLSKTAGFTGTRCGWTVVPKSLACNGAGLHAMWLRRQTTKFNGVSYMVQRGAQAVFTQEGQRQIQENLRVYQKNGAQIAHTLKKLGIWYTGGSNSPYIWLKCPKGLSSWEFFDKLLEQAQIVGTPGSGFGKNGEGYFRLTSFSTHEATEEAMKRLAHFYEQSPFC